MSRIAKWIIERVTRRPPSRVIAGHGREYVHRWFVIPPNRLWGGIHLNHFLLSDDAGSLHDHPYASCSIVLRGSYTEHTIAQGGIHRRVIVRAGVPFFRRSGRIAHGVELPDRPCWSLFIAGGPRYREWGFHHPQLGWIRWDRFEAMHNSGEIANEHVIDAETVMLIGDGNAETGHARLCELKRQVHASAQVMK
jgi:hypothetical protein